MARKGFEPLLDRLSTCCLCRRLGYRAVVAVGGIRTLTGQVLGLVPLPKVGLPQRVSAPRESNPALPPWDSSITARGSEADVVRGGVEPPRLAL